MGAGTIPASVARMSVGYILLVVGWPSLALLCCLFVWRRWITRRGDRMPIAERLLRPPGESLRKRIDDLDDDLGEALVFALVPASAFGAVAALTLSPARASILSVFIFMVPALTAFVLGTIRAFKIAQELRNCRLGFHGERAVGEQLNHLMRDGCHVFHDVPMPPYGNLDHVVIAPSGIYAVETKTRRKRSGKPGSPDHAVIYDGKSLQFPDGIDTKALAQTRQQADRLSAFLSKAVAESVTDCRVA